MPEQIYPIPTLVNRMTELERRHEQLRAEINQGLRQIQAINVVPRLANLEKGLQETPQKIRRATTNVRLGVRDDITIAINELKVAIDTRLDEQEANLEALTTLCEGLVSSYEQLIGELRAKT